MNSIAELRCKYTEEEIHAMYHRRNTWVVFLFIPLMLTALMFFRINALQLWQLLLFNVMTMTVCLIQGYGWEFFDGLKSAIPNTLYMFTGVVAIILEVPEVERYALAYGYCCLMVICTTQKPYITTSLLFCFAAMCLTASTYIILLFCFMLVHFNTPAVTYLMQSFKKHFLILELLLLPVAFTAFVFFAAANKIIYIPMLALLIAEIYYFIPYFKKKFRRRGAMA